MTNQPNQTWMLLNAVECWLYHFPQHQWAPAYKELSTVLQESLANNTEAKIEEAKEEQIQKPQGRRTAPKAASKNA